MRTIENFNSSWRFHRGDDLPNELFSFGNRVLIADETRIWQKTGNHGLSKPGNPAVALWRAVDLPHDYAIEGEFTKRATLNHGSLEHGPAWYVKEFPLAADDVKRRISIEFDGVYRNAEIWCNGHFIGRHLSGYTSFSFDITDYCAFGGMNAIAVHVDARENELWSYEGAGIYRSARLVRTHPLHIPQWGVSVRTAGSATLSTVHASVSVRRDGYDESDGAVRCIVLDDVGRECTSTAGSPVLVEVDPFETATVEVDLEVRNPVLWDLDSPVLYTLVAEVYSGGALVDRFEQRFGFRTFAFDAGRGFFLNGRHRKLKGTCCHQDSAGVGVAVPPALQRWRVERLLAMGCNAIRTSHNPCDPSLLDACDELGMLVMDEQRMSGSSDEILGQLESVVRRDRNHPSVILWSLGNEEMGIQHTDVGSRVFRRMRHLVRRLDPTRPVTYAMNCNWIDICDRYADPADRFDVFGANYRSDQKSERYDEFHAKYPDWPLVGSETWGGASTRGLYEPDRSTIPVEISERWRNNPWCWRDADHRYYASAWGGTRTPWGYSIEEMWQDCASRDFMAGTFVWTGFDYRGETFPYEWPSVITRFGLIDLCGNFKEQAHYLRAWWRPDEPYLFLMPHWNWAGHEGEMTDVWCYGNCAEVELFLNGRSLGRRPMPERFRLEWKVAYEPGRLEAVGYSSSTGAPGASTGAPGASTGAPGASTGAPGAKRICSVSRVTAGASAATALTTWRDVIAADGEDLTVIDVAVTDRDGNVCPLADDLVEFAVEGPGRLLGVGNGNPVSHESDKSPRRHAFHGLCQAIVQSTGEEGVITLVASGRRIGESPISLRAVSGATAKDR